MPTDPPTVSELPKSLTTLLCDADGTLFASEEPAFEASVDVVNRCLTRWGVAQPMTAEGLRREANGQSFRSSLTALARRHGVSVDTEPFTRQLEDWVAEENELVTRRLSKVLTRDPQVQESLTRLASRFRLALVSSSTLSRIDSCLVSTGLAELLPADRRFSAQDSLAVPTSKPDPAVYTLAGAVLGVGPDDALAVEDAVAGAASAVRAGFLTVGMLCFVPPAEVAQRATDLRDVGVKTLVSSWSELEELLAPRAKFLATVAP